MRIALVIERFEPGAGGAENVAWETAHGLARAGDDVTVIARRAAPSQLALERVEVPAAWQPLRVLAFSRAAARAAARRRFDLVYSLCRTAHQHVYRAGAGSHADYLARRHRGSAARLRRLSPRHAALLWLESRALRDPRQRVVCNSQMVRRELCARYGLPEERAELIRNGVDLERFHPRRRHDLGAHLRARLGAAAGPVWLFAGSGFARKGLDTALRAFARAELPEGRLWVAGSGDQTPWRRIAERLGLTARVRFLGFRDDPEALLAAADGLLLPTRYDAFANVCLEAAAAGTPVLTSGANGAAELLAGAGARVDDPEDVAGFADALRRLSDPARARRLGEAGRRIAEGFGWDAHVRALRALFARMRP